MPLSNTSQTEISNALLNQASLIIQNRKFKNKLSIKPERRVALLGLNGAGKSTFIRNLIGESNNLNFDLQYQTNESKLTKQSKQANLSIKANKLISLKPNEQEFKKIMGYQADTMLPMAHLSVFEYLNLCAGFKEVSINEYNINIKQVVSDWYLESIMKQPLKTLSKGNMQKVAIAQVFINNPKFLFFDEPCQSLDPIEQERFNKNITELTGFSLCLFSTHNVNHALTVADDILIIHQSKIAYFYQRKSSIDYLLFSFENEEILSKVLASSLIEYKFLGSGLYKIKNSHLIDEFIKKNQVKFEFCLPEKEALMPLFRLLASNEWQPSDRQMDNIENDLI
ncbi:MAG: ABC-2 type transport system ATP-binding protein [Polaribacter sp.]|jgi:ABC-2 type transport system ATP-binding protein